MKTPYLISCDTHINEPADLFTANFPKRLLPHAPKVERREHFDQWIVDGKIEALTVVAAARCGDRFDPPETRIWRKRLEDVREFCHEPKSWLAEVEKDGIYAAVIFPSLGMMLYQTVETTRVLDVACTVYNDWILDFAATSPDRLRPIVMINLDDIDHAIAEVQRVVPLGAGGVLIPTTAPKDRPYGGAEYEPFWELLEDLQLPITLHVGVDRNFVGEDHSLEKAAGIERMVNQADHEVRICLMQMIFGQVFQRHPRLKVVSVENEGSWALHFLQAMDWHWKNNFRFMASGRRFDTDMLPSDYFRQNVTICFTEDPGLVSLRDFVGIDNLVWGDDFPHAESTYPMSDQILDRLFDGVAEAERHRITVTNGAKLYNIALPDAEPT